MPRRVLTEGDAVPQVWGTPPTLSLNTGRHFEAGAADVVATFIGGGYGEKKAFWKNNEANPLGRGFEAQVIDSQTTTISE